MVESVTSSHAISRPWRIPAQLERKPEVELELGVEPVGRMGADLGDEVIEIRAFGGLPFPLDPKEEGISAIPGGRDDQARPAGRIQGPDISVLPGIEDLRGETDRGRDEKAESDERYFLHLGASGPRSPRCLL